MLPLRGALAVALSLALLAGGCSGSDESPSPTQPTSTASSDASDTPDPADENPVKKDRYVRAPGDPKKHTLNVTIRDKGRVYAPGSCSEATPDAVDFLAFEGPNAEFRYAPIGEEITLPPQAEPQSDGSCAATMTVTLPFKPRYRTGVGTEGKGISTPDDPGWTKVTTKGTSQDIEVLTYKP